MEDAFSTPVLFDYRLLPPDHRRPRLDTDSFSFTLRCVPITGAAIASFTWFAAFGYDARLLKLIFANPPAWRILNAFVSIFMLAFTASLVARAVFTNG